MTPASQTRIRLACEALAEAVIEALQQEPQQQQVERLLSIPEAAQALGGIARSTVYRELGAGRLRSVRVGAGRRMIPSSALADYIASQGER